VQRSPETAANFEEKKDAVTSRIQNSESLKFYEGAMAMFPYGPWNLRKPPYARIAIATTAATADWYSSGGAF
jgi:hypothetical protein